MKNKAVAWAVIFSFWFSLFPVASGQAQQAVGENKVFLAVMEIDNNGGLSKDACTLIADTVRQEFFGTGMYRLVDRKNMAQILNEQGFQMTGCTSSECVVQAGRLLGVEKMVVGSVGKVGNEFLLNLQLLNVETGEMESIATDKCPCPVEFLVDKFKILAQQLNATFMARRPGILELTVNVPGALVTLEGRNLGKSPLKPQSVAAGRYLLRVDRDGYEVWKRQVQVKPGDKMGILVTLVKAKPWYKKAWVWAIVAGVLVAGGGAGAYAATSGGSSNNGKIQVFY